jgi:hypothetical protein
LSQHTLIVLYVDVLYVSYFLCRGPHLFDERFDLSAEAVQLALLGRITLAPGQRLLVTPTCAGMSDTCNPPARQNVYIYSLQHTP